MTRVLARLLPPALVALGTYALWAYLAHRFIGALATSPLTK